MSDKIEKTEDVHSYVRDAYSKIAASEKNFLLRRETFVLRD